MIQQIRTGMLTVGIPAVLAAIIVEHTHKGLNYGDEWMGYAAAGTLAVAIWLLWGVITSDRYAAPIRKGALVCALVLSSIDGYMMYQSKGDVLSTGYEEALHKYNIEMQKYDAAYQKYEADKKAYDTEQARIDALLKAKAESRASRKSALSASMKEVIARNKLSSRRAEMDRYRKELDTIAAEEQKDSELKVNAPPPAPPLRPVEPEKTYTMDKQWVITTVITVLLTPVILFTVMTIAAHERRGDTPKGTRKNGAEHSGTLVEHLRNTCGTLAEHLRNTREHSRNTREHSQFLTEVNGAPPYSSQAILLRTKRVQEAAIGDVFQCPVCDASVEKSRADQTTCGGRECRKTLTKARKDNSNVTMLRPVAPTTKQ